jgi:hypothetical protein
LLQHAGEAKLLLTSRHALGGGLPGVTEKVQHLRRLDPYSAARLVLALAPRDLKLSELGAAEPHLAIVGLMEHPVLQFLSGHPHAIALTEPLLQDKTLAQVHTLVNDRRKAMPSSKKRIYKKALSLPGGRHRRFIGPFSPRQAKTWKDAWRD